jgi:hypothetical protein
MKQVFSASLGCGSLFGFLKHGWLMDIKPSIAGLVGL